MVGYIWIDGSFFELLGVVDGEEFIWVGVFLFVELF